MVTIKLEGMEELIRSLNRIEKEQLPFAQSKALNDVAKLVKQEEIETMKRVFNRPTPYVLRSLYIWPATKSRQSVEVYFKDLSQKIMEPQVYGGPRKFKRSEIRLGDRYWAPGKGARLNQYGNISPGQITQILAALKRLNDPYSWTTSRSLKRNKKPRNYFMVRSTERNLSPGVWERLKNGVVKPILIFIKSPTYQKRFPFYEVAQKVIDKEWRRCFDEAMAYALRTMKR